MGWKGGKTKSGYSGGYGEAARHQYTVCGCGWWDYDTEIEKNPKCKNCGRKYQRQGAGAHADKEAKDSVLVNLFWKQTVEVQAEWRRDFPQVFGHLVKKEEKKEEKQSCQQRFRAAVAALNQAADRKTQSEMRVHKYQTQLDEAKAKLVTVTEDYAKAEIEHESCTKDYANFVRGTQQPPAAKDAEQTEQSGNNHGEDARVDDAGGDDRELAGKWGPLLATLFAEHQLRRPGPLGNSDRAKQESAATSKLIELGRKRARSQEG